MQRSWGDRLSESSGNLKRSGWLDHMEPPGALRSAGVSRKLSEGFESCDIKGIMDY